MAHNGPTTTAVKAELHDVTMPFLTAMYYAFKEFNKKKPDGAVNKAKIKVVNRLLEKCKEVLNDEISIEYLDTLNEDDVPQNSDVVLMLSQYVAAMTQFHSVYFGWSGVENCWALEDNENE